MCGERLSLEEKCAQLRAMIETDREGFSVTAKGEKLNLALGRVYFSEGMAGRECVRDPTYSPVVNDYMMFISVPCYGYDGKPNGVMVSLLRGNNLSRIVSKIDVGGGHHPFVINYRTGDVLGVAEGSEIDLDSNTALSEVVQKAMQDTKESGEYVDGVTGKKMTYCFQPVGGKTDWTVVSCVPYDFYFGELLRLRIILVLTMILSCFVVLVLETLLVHFTIKPLVNVKDAISLIATGSADLTKRIHVSSRDEVCDVVAGFNKFSEKPQSIIKDIQRSKETLSSVGRDLALDAEDTSSSITEVIANIESMHSRIMTQGASVEQTSTALSQISSNIESLEKMIENQ